MEAATETDGAREGDASHDVRCHCGSLVARVVRGHLELKCRRCQRIGLIDLRRSGASDEPVEVRWGEPLKR